MTRSSSTSGAGTATTVACGSTGATSRAWSSTTGSRVEAVSGEAGPPADCASAPSPCRRGWPGPTPASTSGEASRIYLNASGEIRWGTGGRKDGPEGENNSPYNQGRPIPNRPAGALIGRVGDGDAPFFAGSDRGPYEMRGSGRLYLGVNDDYLQDNSGTFRVVVSY